MKTENTTNFKGGKVLIVPFEYPDPNQLTDRSIEQSVLPPEERAQLDLEHDERLNPYYWNQMSDSNELRDQAATEAHELALSRFESTDAVIPHTPELLSPTDEVNGISALTLSIIDRRALELGMKKAFNPVPYVGGRPQETSPQQPTEVASNVYAFPQQRQEPIITRSYDEPEAA